MMVVPLAPSNLVCLSIFLRVVIEGKLIVPRVEDQRAGEKRQHDQPRSAKQVADGHQVFSRSTFSLFMEVNHGRLREGIDRDYSMRSATGAHAHRAQHWPAKSRERRFERHALPEECVSH